MALSPVSITFSRAIWVAKSFEALVAPGDIPKPEGALPFDDADPFDEKAPFDDAAPSDDAAPLDEEAPVVEEAFALEEAPGCDVEAPAAETWALAPGLVSVTL